MKKLGLFFASFIFLSFFLSVVSAAAVVDSIGNFIDSGVDAASPILSRLLGETSSGEWLFAKVLLFIVVFCIVWVVLSRIDFFNHTTWVLVCITLAVSLLSVRWIENISLIQTIILPYSALGIAVSALLPFFLFFLIVNVGMAQPEHRIFRKIAWIFFSIVFIGLWLTRDGLGGSVAPYIYPLTALVAIGMLALDGTIQRAIGNMHLDRAQSHSRGILITGLRRELQQTDADLAASLIDEPEHRRRVADIHRRMNALGR